MWTLIKDGITTSKRVGKRKTTTHNKTVNKDTQYKTRHINHTKKIIGYINEAHLKINNVKQKTLSKKHTDITPTNITCDPQKRQQNIINKHAEQIQTSKQTNTCEQN